MKDFYIPRDSDPAGSVAALIRQLVKATGESVQSVAVAATPSGREAMLRIVLPVVASMGYGTAGAMRCCLIGI